MTSSRLRKPWRYVVWVLAGFSAVLTISFLLTNLGKILSIKSHAGQVPAPESSHLEVVRYTGDGGRLLVGDLLIPESDPHGHIVFAHGNRPVGRRHSLPRKLAALLSNNHVVFAFDFRGYGESERLESYSQGMTLDFSADVAAAVRYLSARFDTPAGEVALVGHSFGALTALLASRELSTSRVVALGPGDPERLFDTEERALYQVSKLSNLGLEVSVAEARLLYSPLFADNLFATCFPGQVTLIAGGFEPGISTLSTHVEALNKRCNPRIETVIMPFVDHMYWTESRDDRRFRLLSRFVADDEWIRALAGLILENLEQG